MANSARLPTQRWVHAARLEDLAAEGPHAISADSIELVALRTNGTVRVFEGRCPHQGALLGEGELDGQALVCRNHRWRFDRETGERIGGRACLKACPSREDAGALLVDTSGLDLDAPSDRSDRSAQPQRRQLADLPGPRGLPFLGVAFEIETTQLHSQLEAWSREYGALYTMRVGGQRMLIISKAELIETIFRARPDTYRRISKLERIFAEMSVAGVFSSEGDAWRAQRRLAMGALAQRHLRGFYPTLSLVTSRLVGRWNAAADAGRELDLADELKRFTVDVTTQLAFGYDLNTVERGDEDVIQRHLELIFPALHRRINGVVPYWRWIRLPSDRRVDRALEAIRVWLSERVKETRERLANDPARLEEPANFLEAMLVAHDPEGRPFTDEVILGNALTMLLAGEDTTAYTIAWAVHHLCDNARASSALRAEIDEVLGDLELPRDVEHAAKLPYTTAVANESMRLRPVAPFIFHEPLRDVVLGDVEVPKGTWIATLGRPPVLEASRFRDPEAFAPERWLTGWEGAHDASASTPFGSGPRICPGRSLAVLEMRVVLAALYRSFEVERVGRSEDVKEVSAFTMMPVGLRGRLRRRTRQVARS